MQHATFVVSKDTLNEHILKKNGQGKGSKHKHVADLSAEQDSSEYDDEFDLNAVSVHALHNHESREMYALVVFHLKGNAKSTLKGMVDTGAMVSCIPMSMLPQIGLSMKDLKPSDAVIRGMSGSDLQKCGTVCVNLTCNEITKKAKFYVTKHDYALILGLEFCKMFKLVTISPVCTLQSVSLEPNQVEAVHITDESEVDYHKLKTKWKEHLPLGRKTGDHLNDLKQIFPETFDGQVGLF